MMKRVVAALVGVSLFIPLVSQAYRIEDPGCTHHVYDATNGSGGYVGVDCSQELLLKIGTDTSTSTILRVDALRAVVSMLTSSIAAIRLQQARVSKASCFVPAYDLYLGRTDAQTNGEVSKLQLWLKAEGYFPDAQGTGYYGEKTAAAVVRWQKDHGMDFVTTKSGVGKMTRAKMQAQCAQVLGGACGFSVVSPPPNSTVSFPLTVKGIVDTSRAQQIGCSWMMSESTAGGAQLYFNYQKDG